jgi:hypothetical protein
MVNKEVREYVYKKQDNVKDGYCRLGYVIKGELKFFDITVEKEKQELENHLKMTQKLDKLKELKTKISKVENSVFKLYDELYKDIDWKHHYNQIYFSSNTENDTRGQDITYLKEIKDNLFINYDGRTYKYYEKPTKERLEKVKYRVENYIVNKFREECTDVLEYKYWSNKIMENMKKELL